MTKQTYYIIYGCIIIFIMIYIIYKKSNSFNSSNSTISIRNKYDFIISNNSKPYKNNLNPLTLMKKYNVIFGGTVRNVNKYIMKNLKHIDRCGNKFNDYLVIIYENDSTDNTRNTLLKYKKSNYEYIFEDNVTEPRRTMRISNGRNKILDKVRKINSLHNNYYNYLIMLDLDDVNISGKFVNTIDSCFEFDNWDVLTGNQSNKYYDLWALRKKDDMEYDCWKELILNSNIINSVYLYVNSKFTKYKPGELLEVDSAFSGIAIYKISSIPDECKYIGEYENGDELCEHVEFNRCIKKSNKNIYINTNFLTN